MLIKPALIGFLATVWMTVQLAPVVSNYILDRQALKTNAYTTCVKNEIIQKECQGLLK